MTEIKKNFKETVKFCKKLLGGDMVLAIDNATTKEMMSKIDALVQTSLEDHSFLGSLTGVLKVSL